jgi:choline dehydrogenase-like flavoprotein
MEHLEIMTAELWMLRPFPTDLFRRGSGPTTRLWCELAITKEVQFEEKILNGTTGLNRLTVAMHVPSRMEVWQDEDPRKSWRTMRKNYTKADSIARAENIKGAVERAYEFQTRIEQAPNPDSRITIDNEKDELGVPRANLHWDLTELDKRSVRKVNLLIGEELARAGVGRVRLREHFRNENDMGWPVGTNAGWHHMGTTRMGTDLGKSVVDRNCQVHGISNLFVAGSGCYVTGAAPNPTLTIVALSLRLSDYIKSKIDA